MQARTIRRALSAIVLTALAAPALAEADGPDHFRVLGEGPVALRAGPDEGIPAIAEIPPGADGIVNFGCIGGLSLAEWQDASDAERTAGTETRWCKVGHGEVIGWAHGPRLGEGGDTGDFAGHGHLASLAGSEWAFRDFVGAPAEAEAWIAFGADGAAHGDSGCNAFRGSYEASLGRLSLGPIAMTRKLCHGAEGATETAAMAALEATHGAAASHALLALFAENGDLLATLTRRDAD